jgi:hypothetical protein
VLRLGFHLHGAAISFIDLVSYTGYCYVGLCLNTFASLFLGRLFYYVVLLWTSSALGYFYIKTLAEAMFSAADGMQQQFGGSSRQAKKNKQYFLFGIGAAQPFLMWFMGY